MQSLLTKTSLEGVKFSEVGWPYPSFYVALPESGLRLWSQAEVKDQELTGVLVQVNPDVPEMILCDGLRLKQILNNLLSNALKFTQNGYVALEVSVTTTHISFSVVDTGPGIPEHKHEMVFEKFRQADERVSYEHGGTGLGLALSKALADLMSGDIELQSKVGEGSRFTLVLPLQLKALASDSSSVVSSSSAPSAS
jgi:signal transduction histidine kinase